MHHVTANGAEIPALGFGTFELEPGDAEAMVEHALRVGYRHIDTAQMYDNEESVGRGIKNAGVAREDVFLTTKLWTDRFHDGDLQQAMAESLSRLGADYVDLVLLHWPNDEVSITETTAALADVKRRGMARHVGISNFTTRLIHEAAKASPAALVTNQVEYHPFLDQSPVRDALAEHDIALTAYCPLARGEVFANDTLKRIGQTHGKNAGQVALRWLVQQDNVIAVPRSSNPDHVAANFEIFDFELSAAEMQAIFDLHTPDGRMIDPSFAPDWYNAA